MKYSSLQPGQLGSYLINHQLKHKMNKEKEIEEKGAFKLKNYHKIHITVDETKKLQKSKNSTPMHHLIEFRYVP